MSTFLQDPAWLDAQYNNRARIPEHPQIFARWAADSAAARQSLRCALDLPYGGGPKETLDVFPAGPKSPVLAFIHGGWWRALDKADHSFLAQPFVEAGVTVAVPNYALCPAVTIEDITLQMVKALAWVARHIAAYGGDPDRIVVAGHSAGGHLAAMLASCDWRAVGKDLPADLVKSALAISGLFDLEPVRLTPHLQGDLRLTPASVRRLSPAGVPPPAVPVYTVVGALESEEFLRQNGLLREAWGPRAVPVCEAIPDTHHLNVIDTLARPGARLHELALALLRQA
jgi:arylformamidase